ncbi:MAG: hypothetical protein IPK59_12440 [Rhodospirillaceae bacterium]|nr:hypothetical protein [Rhodospirillaceae bacterium]
MLRQLRPFRIRCVVIVIPAAAARMKTGKFGEGFQQGRLAGRIFADQDGDRVRETQFESGLPEYRQIERIDVLGPVLIPPSDRPQEWRCQDLGSGRHFIPPLSHGRIIVII